MFRLWYRLESRSYESCRKDDAADLDRHTALTQSSKALSALQEISLQPCSPLAVDRFAACRCKLQIRKVCSTGASRKVTCECTDQCDVARQPPLVCRSLFEGAVTTSTMHLPKRSLIGDFELEIFIDEDTLPPYAILSHTWLESEEVTYQELRDGSHRHKSGYEKICHYTSQAERYGLKYFWVDTCCIDKTSSAELQEAISSMFRWYEKAQVCHVYLNDVADPSSIHGGDSQFHKARWHTRGWTLQELLAPRRVEFYTMDWIFIGTKADLRKQLSGITRIPEDVLTGDVSISRASVAQRMSWASPRKTTRPEDVAYSLMGIFSANMTMLYGEGKKAFLRLQEEICREIHDDSIFAWQHVDELESGASSCGLFADHPRHFRNASLISKISPIAYYGMEGTATHQTTLSMMNSGIQMKAYTLPWTYLKTVLTSLS